MQAQDPSISIVIPTHNRIDLLPRALESVLQQDFDDYELIVVDDASSDHIGDYVCSLDDNRIRYLRCEDNGGAARARNIGISAARGEFVSFLDDDDQFLPGFLRAMVTCMQAAPPQVGLAWCGTRSTDMTPAGRRVQEGIWQPHFTDREHAYLSFLRSRQVGTGCGLTVRRESIVAAGMFDENLRCAEDTDLLIRMVRLVDFVVVPQVLVQVNRHEGARLTTYGSNMADAYVRIMDKHLSALQSHPQLWSALLYKTGWLYYHGENSRAGRRYIAEALKRNPLNGRAWAALLTFESLGHGAIDVHRRFSQMRKSVWR